MNKIKMKKIHPVVLIIAIVAVLFGGIFVYHHHFEKKTSGSNLTSNQTLANPASVNCTKKGGTNVNITLGNGAQDGICQFEDNQACGAWALMRGECPVGGIKTTGYDNEGQKYCTWLGGKTLAVPNSQCTLPNGTVCSTDDLWAGTCN